MVVITSQRRDSTEEQGASGGALDGDEDGASHFRLNLRGIAAAYRATRKPGDEAEDFSSRARHMECPVSGPRGGNAANESKDGDDFPDGDGEGLTALIPRNQVSEGEGTR